MGNTNIFLLVLLGYTIVMVLLSLLLKNQANKSIEDYGLATGRFGCFALTLVTIGAWVGSGGLIGLTTWSYDGGMSTWWGYGITYFMMLPFAIIYVRRIRVLQVYTISDFFVMRYPKYNGIIRYPTAVLYIIRNATVLGMQLNALALLFKAFLGWDHWIGVCVAAAIAVLYTAISGFLSIMFTNLLQSIFQTIAPFVIIVFILWYVGGMGNVTSYYTERGLEDALSIFTGVDWYHDVFYYFLGSGIFFLLGDLSDWQRVAASKSGKASRNSFILSVVLVTPILLLPSYAGLCARLAIPEGTVDSNAVFYEIIKLAPAWVEVLLIIGVLSTVFSCIASYLFAGGMIISNDIIIQFKERKNHKLIDKQKIFYSRIGIVINCCLGIVSALWIPGILDLFTRGLIIAAAGLLIPYLFAWHSKKMNTEGALAGMISGGGIALIWSILGNPFGVDAVWIGLPICLIACLVVRSFTASPGKEVYETYYASEKFDVLKTE